MQGCTTRLASAEDETMSRLLVMHKFNPIFSFLFDDSGTLLLATPRALNYYKGAPPRPPGSIAVRVTWVRINNG